MTILWWSPCFSCLSVFRVALLCVFMFWDPCCTVRYDFLIKTMFGSSLHPVVFEGTCLICVIFVCFMYSGFLFCQFLWIVHFWLPLRYSLMFIYPFYRKFNPFKNISDFHTWYFVASITIIYIFKFVDRVMSVQNIINYFVLRYSHAPTWSKISQSVTSTHRNWFSYFQMHGLKWLNRLF